MSPRTLTHIHLRLAFLTLGFLLGATMLPAATAAQTPGFPFPITKFNCEEDPGVISQAEIPEGCVTVEGVVMTVYDGEDNILGTCVTGEGGKCIVNIQVPADSMVYVEEDVSTATPGYVPIENPVAVEVVMEFSEAKLVNLPEAPDLPNNGSGTPAAASGVSAFSAMLATVAVALSLGATSLRLAIRRAG